MPIFNVISFARLLFTDLHPHPLNPTELTVSTTQYSKTKLS